MARVRRFSKYIQVHSSTYKYIQVQCTWLQVHPRVHPQWRIQDFSDGGAHTWFWKCDVTKTTFFLLACVEAMFVHAQNLVALDSNEPRYNSRRGSARQCAPSLDPPLIQVQCTWLQVHSSPVYLASSTSKYILVPCT